MPFKPAEPQKGFKPIAPEQPKPVAFSVGEMISNIPSSAADMAGNLYQSVRHPIDTAKAVGNLAMGGIDKAAHALTDALPESVVRGGNELNNFLVDKGIPLERQPENTSDMSFPKEVYADQVGQFVLDRYGSVDNFKATLMKDPVGVLTDAASVLSLAGGAGRLVTKAGTAPGNIASGMQKIGAAIDPVNVVINAGKSTAKLLPKTLPSTLYEKAAKFSTTIPKAKRAGMVSTALDNKIMPTSKGVDRLNELTSGLSSQIDDLISTASQEGKVIHKNAVFTHLKELRKAMGGAKVEGGKDLRSIDRIAKSFSEHMKSMNKDFLTPDEMQAFKQDLYSKIKFDRKQGASKMVKEETFKNVGRAAKESIEKVAPGVKPLNAKLGELLDIKEPIQRSANRIDNLNIMPLTAPISIGAGGVVGGGPGAAAATIASILEMPRVKSKLAIGLNAIQKQKLAELLMSNSPMMAGMRQGLTQAGNLSQEQLPTR
jgi:hypothetical protein